jgi:hypothetical protein
MTPRGGGTKRTHTPVESLKNQDRRPNIPTEELSAFVKKDETKQCSTRATLP